MKRFLYLLMLLPLLAACADGDAENAATTALNGPSLVMFYTEN